MRNSESFLLPLFPLNVVLYPGMFLPLHIFEERYLAMINYCLKERTGFGVVLISKGMPEGEKAAIPRSVGTMVKIIQIQKTGRGRMNIWALGSERFEILDYHLSADAYLVGRVQRLPDDFSDSALYNQSVEAARRAFDEYLATLKALDVENNKFDAFQLADEPDILSYQIAEVLNISLADKQTLLELNDARARLEAELAILKREIEHLQQLLKTPREKSIKLPWGGKVSLN